MWWAGNGACHGLDLGELQKEREGKFESAFSFAVAGGMCLELDPQKFILLGFI